MTRSSADIEREVEQARERLDQTTRALRDRMQPGELIDEATRMMSGASNKVLTTATQQLRENPIPIALIGLGVAWLAINQMRSRDGSGGAYDSAGYYPIHEGYDEDDGLKAKVKAKAQQAKAKLTETASKAKAGLAQARADAGETTSGARGRIAAATGALQARAETYADMARRRFDDTLANEPLVIGAIGLAVGAAIGASMPSTPAERRYIGPARSKAAEAARAQLEDVKDAAQRAYSQVKEELHRQTGPEGEGASLSEKAGSIAGAGAETLKSELRGGTAH